MEADSGVKLKELKVDGGMVYNDLLMQFQADVLSVPVIRPKVAETTALGAAYAAGLAVGFWKNVDDLRANWGKDNEWKPKMDAPPSRRSTRSGRRPSPGRSTGWTDRTRGPTGRRTHGPSVLRIETREPAWRTRSTATSPRAQEKEHGARRAPRRGRSPRVSDRRSTSIAAEGKHGDFAEGEETRTPTNRSTRDPSPRVRARSHEHDG